jgi:hypothetical protein
MPSYTRTTVIGSEPCSCTDDPRPYVVGGTRFLYDHEDRGLFKHANTVEIPGPRSTRIAVWMRSCDAKELMSDAEYYGSSMEDYGQDPWGRGLVLSARSVAKHLHEQGVERQHPTWFVKGMAAK